MKAQDREKEEALARLREWVKPGDTIYTVLRHVSRTGMSRTIQLVKIGERVSFGVATQEPIAIGFLAAKAMGDRYDRDREGIKVGGCGMDMGFALVYNLGWALWPKGFGCVGEQCRSNDHSNGDRDRTPHGPTYEHWHNDGGYALNHRWL